MLTIRQTQKQKIEQVKNILNESLDVKMVEDVFESIFERITNQPPEKHYEQKYNLMAIMRTSTINVAIKDFEDIKIIIEFVKYKNELLFTFNRFNINTSNNSTKLEKMEIYKI